MTIKNKYKNFTNKRNESKKKLLKCKKNLWIHFLHKFKLNTQKVNFKHKMKRLNKLSLYLSILKINKK